MSKEERNTEELKTTYEKLIEAICRSGAPFKSNDKKAAKLIREAVAAGFPIDYQNEFGRTLLHCAAAENKPECCRALIELGADIDLQDKWGETSLHLTCRFWLINVVKLLIDGGARHRQVTDKFVSVAGRTIPHSGSLRIF